SKQGGNIGCAWGFHPIGFSIKYTFIEESDRITAILQIDETQISPWCSVSFRGAILVHKPHKAAVLKDWQPFGRAGIAILRERTPFFAGERRATPYCPIDWVSQNIEECYGALRVERTKT